MADETINLNLRADLTQLRSELGKIPGITEAEAKKMVGALSTQLKKADAAAKRTAAGMKRANQQAFQDIKQGAEKVFGGIVGDITDVSKGLAVLGPAGIAAGAGIAAIGGSAFVIGSLAAEVWEAAYSVEELDAKFKGLSVPGFVRATDEAVAASQNLHASTEAVGLVLDQAYLEVGNRVAPVLDDLAGYVLTGGLAAKDAYVHYLGLRDSFIDLVGPAADFAEELMPITHLLRAGAGASGEYQAQAIVLTTQLRAKAAAEKHASEIAKAGEEATRAAEKAERDRAKAVRDAAAALREKQAIEQESILADQELFQLAEEGEAQYRKEEAEAAAKAAEAAALAAQERIDLGKAISAAKAQQLATDARNDDAYFDGLAEKAAKQKAATAAAYDFLAGAAQDLLAVQIAAAEGGTKAQKKAGMAAWVASQTITGAQIVLDGIKAVSAALTIPPPAGPVLAVATAATYAGLAAQVAAAPPPKFHTGGEVNATLLDGEHVMDRRASRNNREALEEMNRTGELPSGGDSRAYVVIGDRMADDITTRGIRGPKSTAALRTSGRTGRTRTYR